MDTATWKFDTRAIHAGQAPDPVHGAVMPSICMTSTYAQSFPGEHQGYDYTRAGNPNFTQLEALLASLEEAAHATIFSSGLGATSALLCSLRAGARVVAVDGLYGGTYRLFTSIMAQRGIDFVSVPASEVEAALRAKATELLYFETPTNPLLSIADIEQLCALARRQGIASLVDNTFATPVFQNPLDLGADLVLHSTTKYINGHSDLVGGVIMCNDAEWKKRLDFARMAIGVNPSPFDAWLTLRGVKTLALRLEKQADNAEKLAHYFETHPLVSRVYYPGLASHPGHEIAKRQMRRFGGMLSVEFKMPLEDAQRLVASLQLFTLAESLGGVESLVCHPSSMTHASIPPKERRRIGLDDGLIRFSCGIEAAEDLIEDVEAQLKAAQAG